MRKVDVLAAVPPLPTDKKPTGTTRRVDLDLFTVGLQLSEEPPGPDLLNYLAREMVLVTLPHRTPKPPPGQKFPEPWSRSNGFVSLTITPGYRQNPKTQELECVGIPSGTIPRLLLYWVTTEAVRKRQRVLQLNDTLNGFLRDLGMNPETGGGKNGDAARLRLQMERLFRSRISLEYQDDVHKEWVDMQVTSGGELWWDPKRPEQVNLFRSYIELGERFYRAITDRPVPVDIRALRKLKRSPLALDLYGFLCYRSFVVNQQGQIVPISWTSLHKQFGRTYKSRRNFKKSAKLALEKIRHLYPRAPFEVVHGGIDLLPGRQMIPSRSGR